MEPVRDCQTLNEVRAEIDPIDQAIVRLLAERGGYVRQAARFKRTTDEVRTPRRVAAVIARGRMLAEASELDPAVAEPTYRATIAAFIEREMAAQRRQAERMP